MDRKEFGFVNLVVEKTNKEVKIWACSDKGQNVFRLKATGKVYAATINDIIVTGGEKKVTEFKYCIETTNGKLLTNDLSLVREFLGLTKLRLKPSVEPKEPLEEIFPKVVETEESFLVRHPHSSSTITKTKVNEVNSIICDIYAETKKPVHWKEVANKTEISDVNLKRALFVLKTRGIIKTLKAGRKRLYLPQSAEYVLDEIQRLAVETVGKALKEEWKARRLV